MNGQRAFEHGLVHRVYPAGADLLTEARPFLEQLARLDQAAYRETKRALLDGLDLSFEGALR